ncbi:hypothetical protein ACWTU6_31270, partial [Mesorhizobium sp. BHbsci]
MDNRITGPSGQTTSGVMIPKNDNSGQEMWDYLRRLTGLTPPLPDPMDMDSTIGLTVDDYFRASDVDVDGGTYPQAHEHLSVQAFGEQEHVSRPAVPMETVAGPGDSAPGFAAADWGAIENPHDDEQDPGDLLYPSAEPDWLQ